MSNYNNGTPTHKSLFLRYRDETVILKTIQYARWTLPQLMADLLIASAGKQVTLERDYQEIGALLVNNLSSKLAGLLFPSSRPFFKIKASPAILKAAKDSGVQDSEVTAGLSKLEMDSCQQLYLNASYEQLVLALKHLIVGGQCLLYRNSQDFKTLTYGLQSFGVRRDGQGNLMDCVLREFTDYESLSPAIQEVLAAKHRMKYKSKNEGRNTVELYTRIKRERNVAGKVVFVVTQQADNCDVGKPGTYPEHLCPWQVPCWSLIAGENYGRGLVEDYAGGFAKLSDSSHSATLYEIEMGKVVHLVAPGQGANIDELANSETGEYVSGTKEAVSVYEAGDGKKLEMMSASIEATFSRLARAFMYKANTRDAERVTAFELKQDAMEAENTLGGVYSSLSASMQIPLAHVLLTEVGDSMMEAIVTEQVKLDIMAGIPALGRQADVQNLAAAAQDAAAIIPVFKQLSTRIDTDAVMDIIFAGSSVDTSTIYKSKEQIAEEQDAAKQQAQGEAQIAQSTTLADQQNALGAIQG